jgi:hypothetical protein
MHAPGVRSARIESSTATGGSIGASRASNVSASAARA